MLFAAIENLHTGSPASDDGHARDECIGENGQVRAVQVWVDVGTEYRFALAVSNADIGDGCATCRLHHSSIGAFEGRYANRASGHKRRRRQWVRFGGRLDEDRPAGAAILRIGCAMPVFDAAVDAKYGFIS